MAASLSAEGHGEAFVDTFETLDDARWRIAEHTVPARFNQTSWSAAYVDHTPGTLTLRFDDTEKDGKPFTGSEIKTRGWAHYGRYEVTMRPSPVEGILSSFFVYTGPFFDDPVSEIDFEFKGEDTTQVLLTYHTPEGSDGEFVDLGFDAALEEHTYAFEWEPERIRWYVNDVLLREVEADEIGMPSAAGQIYMSVWSGASDFTGVPQPGASGEAVYSRVAFTPREAPVALPDQAHVASGASVEIDVLANDSAVKGALDPGSVEIVEAPSAGTATVMEDGRILYEAAAEGGIQELTYRVRAGEAWSNAATLALAVDMPILETFSTDRGGFHYSDSAFRNATAHDEAALSQPRGRIGVALGQGEFVDTVEDLSGGWSRSFTLSEPMQVTLDLGYRLRMRGPFTNPARAEALVKLNETLHLVNEITVDGQTARADTGDQTARLDLGVLPAGTHVLTLGGYLSRRTSEAERANVSFDDVRLSLSPARAAQEDARFAILPEVANPPAPALLEQVFEDGSGGFSFTADPAGSAVGSATDGALHLGFAGREEVPDEQGIRGVWSAPVAIGNGQGATVTLRHRIVASDPDAAQSVAVFVSIGDKVMPLFGPAQDAGGPFTETVIEFETLDAGRQTISLGAATRTAKTAESNVDISFDAVTVEMRPQDQSAGLALDAPDPWLDENEARLATFILSGMERGSEALIVISDGASDVMQTTDTNGAILFDLGALSVGPLSSELIVTDDAGEMMRVPGPPLQLREGAGDDDLDLALTNGRLGRGEDGALAVRLDVIGLDTDATAVVTVANGDEVVTASAASDGSVILPLGEVRAEVLTSQVEAVDAFGNSSVVVGPDLVPDPALVPAQDAAGN
ncbi:family 16 glycosylhydrolase [Aestuariibius insulae]|uniref:family 16 glycosylhydrolase n=1 Tax=Aestuariibius insulae TaxID=2058287 RepID=UPI00398E8223